MDERIIFTKDGVTYTCESLARKIKGDLVAFGADEVGNDEETALAALAGFDEAEGITNTMSADELADFVDDFVEAWTES